jgi:dihydropyrimidine dehydrogenase (NAD+) subunit PreT
MVYRRGREAMGGLGLRTGPRRDDGVKIITDAMPVAIHGNGAAREVEFAYTRQGETGLEPTGETFRLRADQVFKAIGQTLAGLPGKGSRRMAARSRSPTRGAPACPGSGRAAIARRG